MVTLLFKENYIININLKSFCLHTTYNVFQIQFQSRKTNDTSLTTGSSNGIIVSKLLKLET